MDKDGNQLNPRDLWIGDLIKHGQTGILGTFDGVHEGKISLKHREGLIFGAPDEFVLVDVKEEMDEDTIDDDLRSEHLEEAAELDLHLSSLDPSREGDNPILIRQFQLRKCKEFIAQAINQRLHSVVIIHGKGAGILESDVLSYLADVEEVVKVDSVHQGGATRVVFG